MRRYLPILIALLFLGGALGLALDTLRGDDKAVLTEPTAATTSTTTATATSPAPTATAAPSSTTTRPPGTVTLAFGGDVHFEGRIDEVLADDPTAVLAGVRDVLSGADIAMVNLETAITTRGTPAEKVYTFRAPAAAYTALKAGGVDLVSLANNHGMDYGRVGFDDTLGAASSARFPVIGAGRNADAAYAPHVVEAQGRRIAFIAATQVLDAELAASWTATDRQPGLASALDPTRLIASVRAARQAADTVVVYLHWGTEPETCPNDRQPTLARQLVDAGADIVVGGHTHRLMGAGRMDRAFVAYGLGNFVFYKDSGPATDSGVLLVEVAGRDIKGYDWVPARLVNQLPRTLSGSSAAAADRSWDNLRTCTGLAS